MKYDMHCHTKEGSMDGQVIIEEYISRLQELGFGGMLVSDHNTYNGYREWKQRIKGKTHLDFHVLKGIEYDTFDAGHFLVIMPTGMKLRILELRGLPIRLLIKVVHYYGGILGPAHPCGEKFLSIANTKKKTLYKLMPYFDFVEIFNSCESELDNQKAKNLAAHFHKPGFGGSDAHKMDCIGMAYTELPDWITTESDLIGYVRTKPDIPCGGSYYTHTTKDKLGPANKLLVNGFFLYNKVAGLFRSRKRYIQMKMLNYHGLDYEGMAKKDSPKK